MTEIIKNAIDKIDKEAENSKVLKPFAQYLIDIIKSDAAAEKVLDVTKTLKNCYESITKKARKEAINNCACIDSETVYTWLKEYFGLDAIIEDEQKISKLDAIIEDDEKISNIVNFDLFADL